MASPTPEKQRAGILFLGSQMAVGGAQMLLFYQAQWFYQQGYRVEVAFLYDRDQLAAEWQARYPFPVRDLRFPRPGTGGVGAVVSMMGGLWRLWRLMRTGRFAAVQTFTHHSNLLGIPPAWLAGVPVRLASHHGRIGGFPAWMNRLHTWMINAGLATCLVVVSEQVRQQSIADGISPARIVLIPNGVAQAAAAADARPRLRSQLGVSEEGSLVLSVGRLAPQKGHHYLLQAVPAVLAQWPQTVFALVGDGSSRPELEAEAQRLGIESQVRFLGTQANVPDWLAAADVFVLPSISEGLPVALLEAMIAGRAVVATDVGGVGEVVQDGQTGRLVPPADVPALAQGLLDLLKDEVERSRLAAAGQERVKRDYTLEEMCKRYAGLIFPA